MIYEFKRQEAECWGGSRTALIMLDIKQVMLQLKQTNCKAKQEVQMIRKK